MTATHLGDHGYRFVDLRYYNCDVCRFPAGDLGMPGWAMTVGSGVLLDDEGRLMGVTFICGHWELLD